MTDIIDLITQYELNVHMFPSIVYVSQQDNLRDITAGVKYSDVGGDRGAALVLAVEKCIQSVKDGLVVEEKLNV